MGTKIIYDITLDAQLVGDSGDMEFDTKVTAIADAKRYISSALSKEYNRNNSDFKILLYKVKE